MVERTAQPKTFDYKELIIMDGKETHYTPNQGALIAWIQGIIKQGREEAGMTEDEVTYWEAQLQRERAKASREKKPKKSLLEMI